MICYKQVEIFESHLDSNLFNKIPSLGLVVHYRSSDSIWSFYLGIFLNISASMPQMRFSRTLQFWESAIK